REERVPLAGMDARETEKRRDLGETDRVGSALGVPSYFVARQLRAPERNERQRDEPSPRAAAPLLDHPVVVRAHAQQRELAVVGFEKRLAAEARERRERERRVRVVDVHVLEPRLRLVTAAAHLVERDGDDLHLVARKAGGG